MRVFVQPRNVVILGKYVSHISLGFRTCTLPEKTPVFCVLVDIGITANSVESLDLITLHHTFIYIRYPASPDVKGRGAHCAVPRVKII